MQRQLVRDDLTVGIIITFFKNIAYLCELLDSIHNQSCQSYEVLLVDDSPKQLLEISDVVSDLGAKYSILEIASSGSALLYADFYQGFH